MANFRVIWKHEVKQADKAARLLIERRKVQNGWKLLFLTPLLANYIHFRKNLILLRKNLLFTNQLAFKAAKAITRGKSRAEEVRMIEVRTKEVLDREKKGFYTDKIRRRQVHEIELLIDHYLGLLLTRKSNYTDMVRASYESRDNYHSFLERLQRAEQEVIEAATTTMKKGTKKERYSWFTKLQQVLADARMEELERMFPDAS